MILKKKKIFHKMQREKLYSLQRTVCFLSILFMLKDTLNCVRPTFHNGKRLAAQRFSLFESKKYAIKIHFSLQFVELFTLHLLVYFAFLKYSDIRATIVEKLKFAIEISSRKYCL